MKTFFLTILLQSEAITVSILQSLADQSLSLAILGLLSVALWKHHSAQQKQMQERIKMLEEKLERLQDEYRKELVSALNRCADFMEQLKNRL